MWPAGLKVAPIGQWPGAQTRDRRRSQFDSTMSSTMGTLTRELEQLGAKNVELQVAIPASQFRLDGYPRSTARAEHPGIILTLDSRHGALSYPCDTFDRWEDNLRAVALALEALRKVDRYGVTKRGEQYRGFLALEATSEPAGFADAESAVEWLLDYADEHGVEVSVERALRRAQRKAHPDLGGDAATFQRVSLAEAKLREGGLL
jgi:hypothetical protein